MATRRIHYRRTTAQQRKLLFETWEETGNISKACRKAHVGRGTFYYWQARFEEEGYKGLEEFKNHAPSNPNRIKEEVEQAVIEMKQEHQDWGKKRIADELAGWNAQTADVYTIQHSSARLAIHSLSTTQLLDYRSYLGSHRA